MGRWVIADTVLIYVRVSKMGRSAAFRGDGSFLVL